jgi:hypothetical protein
VQQTKIITKNKDTYLQERFPEGFNPTEAGKRQKTDSSTKLKPKDGGLYVNEGSDPDDIEEINLGAISSRRR